MLNIASWLRARGPDMASAAPMDSLLEVLVLMMFPHFKGSRAAVAHQARLPIRMQVTGCMERSARRHDQTSR